MSGSQEIRDARKGKKKKGLGKLGLALRGGDSHQATWGDCEPESIAELVCALTDAEGAVLFGRSRDGMALSVTLHLDGDRQVVWLDGKRTATQQIIELVDRIKDTLV